MGSVLALISKQEVLSLFSVVIVEEEGVFCNSILQSPGLWDHSYFHNTRKMLFASSFVFCFVVFAVAGVDICIDSAKSEDETIGPLPSVSTVSPNCTSIVFFTAMK